MNNTVTIRIQNLTKLAACCTITILFAVAPFSSYAYQLRDTNQGAAVNPRPGESCGDFFERVNEFGSGIIATGTNAKPTFSGGPASVGPIKFKRGDRVIVADPNSKILCVASIYKFSRNAWVPRSYVHLSQSVDRSGAGQWSGVWVKQTGTWFAISVIPAVGIQIVDGLACSNQCINFGFSGAPPLGRLTAWPLSQQSKNSFAWTRLFEAPLRHFAYQDQCHGPSSNSSCSTKRIAPDIANSCRFYATLLPDVHRLVVSDQRGSCGGLGVDWTGMYYLVAPYPPYADMSEYFKKLGIKFSTIPEQTGDKSH